MVGARGKMSELREGTESSLQICGQKGGKRRGGQKQGLSCSQGTMAPELRGEKKRRMRRKSPTCWELQDLFLCVAAMMNSDERQRQRGHRLAVHTIIHVVRDKDRGSSRL